MNFVVSSDGDTVDLHLHLVGSPAPVDITFQRNEKGLVAKLEGEICRLFGFGSAEEFEYGLAPCVGGSDEQLTHIGCDREVWSLENGDVLHVRKIEPKLAEGQSQSACPCCPSRSCHVAVAVLLFLFLLLLLLVAVACCRCRCCC